MSVLKNAKEKKFVQGLINGLSQRKAYKAAYPNSLKWKDVTVDVRACELFKQSKILVRFQELQKKSEDEAIMSAIDRKKWLTDMLDNEDIKPSDRLKAMDILNKMTGEYIEKIEMKSDVNINNPFTGLTTDELKKLTKIK